MSIHRLQHQDNFTVIHNNLIYNRHLSWKAKGILIYLLSKPEQWKPIISDMVQQSTDGREAVRGGLNELIREGHISRRQVRDRHGQISCYEYEVFEEVPETDKPSGDSLKTDLETLLNINDNKIDNSNNSSEQKDGSNCEFDQRVKEVSAFFHWYTHTCYPFYKEEAHPRLKKEQEMRVCDVLMDFMDDVSVEMLQEMAVVFFERTEKSNHNINHFATEGVLKTKYYEAEFGPDPLRNR